MQPQQQDSAPAQTQTLAALDRQLEITRDAHRKEKARLQQLQSDLTKAQHRAHGKAAGHHDKNGNWVGDEAASDLADLEQQERECAKRLATSEQGVSRLFESVRQLLQEVRTLEEREKQIVKELEAPLPMYIQGLKDQNEKRKDQAIVLLREIENVEKQFEQEIAAREQWRARPTAGLERVRESIERLKGESAAASQQAADKQ